MESGVRTNKSFLVGVFLITACVLTAPGWADDGGNIVGVTGDVKIVRANTLLTAECDIDTPIGNVKNGSALQVGDVIQTGEVGHIHWTLQDDSLFVMPRKSSFRIDAFSQASAGKDGKAIFMLLKGGFKTVTGRVGTKRGDTYEVRTPMATITIQSLDDPSALKGYTVVLKKGGRYRHPHLDGLYVRVDQGEVKVGMLVFSAGQIGFVDEKGSKPVSADAYAQEVFEADGGFYYLGCASRQSQRIEPNLRDIPLIVPPETPASPS